MLKKVFKTAVNLFDKLFCVQEHTTLIYDFNKCRDAILYKNQQAIINRLMQTIRKEMLKTDGLLITDEQARKAAIEIFNIAKECGDIDCINNVIQKKA